MHEGDVPGEQLLLLEALSADVTDEHAARVVSRLHVVVERGLAVTHLVTLGTVAPLPVKATLPKNDQRRVRYTDVNFTQRVRVFWTG